MCTSVRLQSDAGSNFASFASQKKKKKKNQEGQNTQRSLASFPGLHTAVYHTAINEMVGGALRKG